MDLTVFCKSCKKHSKIKSKANSRPDLVDSIGEYFNHKCKSCGSVHEYHVNQVKAQSSGSFIGLIAGLLVIVLVTMFFWEKGWITNFGMIIGLMIIIGTNGSALTSNTKAFNKYFVKATVRE